MASRQLASLGLKFTKIYLVLLFGGLPVAMYFGVLNVKPLEINELGDFLAGAFGPLAIFWLVLGFFQQSKELQNSVDALNLQAKELAHSVEQQKEMVRVTRETLEHEREVLSLQAQAQKNRLQPKLDIKFGANSKTGTQYRYFARVNNIGHTVANFSIDFFFNARSFLHVNKELLRFEDTAEHRSNNNLEAITEPLTAIATFDDSEGDTFESEYQVTYLGSENDWPRYTLQRTRHEKRTQSNKP
ncbi:hypothetical protein [Ruegeria sp. HKCCD8929]|uniref:hypothetical protein n=1 Tax=Ruegeria sp. HKCCD8929 TaxID=2683006 RepID=UPI001487BEFE|nr:hypothetical protein [Ruegeria sp. HKCCD8929]